MRNYVSNNLHKNPNWHHHHHPNAARSSIPHHHPRMSTSHRVTIDLMELDIAWVNCWGKEVSQFATKVNLA